MSYARNIQIPDEPPITIVAVFDAPGIGGFELTDVARLSLPNVFRRENTFPAVRIVPRLVINDYNITHLDGEIVVDCSVNDQDITLVLPISGGNGQDVQITRIDETTHTVSIVTQGDDVMVNGMLIIALDPFQVAILRAALPDFWSLGLFIPPFVLPSNIAVRDQYNFFTNINSFAGIKFARRIVSDSGGISTNDCIIYVRGATADVDLFLPPALIADGRGQFLRVVKLDDNEFVVRIWPFEGDTIDGAASVSLVDYLAEAQLYEADFSLWNNTGPTTSSGGGGGSLPTTTNLLAGDGLGDAVDSGIDPADVVVKQTAFPTPATINDIISCLQAAGLCA